MKSRWYIPFGTTSETTSISGRENALRIITASTHLDKSHFITEDLWEKVAHKQSLKEGMTREIH